MECSVPQNAQGTLCANASFITLAIVIINVVTDFYLLALPIGIVIRLNAKRGKRARTRSADDLQAGYNVAAAPSDSRSVLSWEPRKCTLLLATIEDD